VPAAAATSAFPAYASTATCFGTSFHVHMSVKLGRAAHLSRFPVGRLRLWLKALLNMMFGLTIVSTALSGLVRSTCGKQKRQGASPWYRLG
jgi:hypothetical protein